MGVITISVDDETEQRFRESVRSQKGEGKGFLGKAVSEAMRNYLTEKEQTQIAAEALASMRKGFPMGKILWKNRAELHERD